MGLRRRCPPTHDAGRHALKADLARQWRLLDLQALDTRLDQIDHRKSTLPSLKELAVLDVQASTLEDQVIMARTAALDVQREVAKADADTQLVRERMARNQAKLDSGQGGAKDLQALQHEVTSLERRQSALEEVELEVMERSEGLDSELAELEGSRAELGDRICALQEVRDNDLRELDTERDKLAATRADIVAGVGEELVALYDKIRASSGGLGAAALSQRRCGGCQLELGQVDLNRIGSADQDEVVRCDECRRILVRTTESGLCGPT